MLSSNSYFRLIVVVFCVFLYAFECEAYTPYAYNKTAIESTPNYDAATGVVIDSQNYVYMLGLSDGSLFSNVNDTSKPDFVIAKYVSVVNNDTLNRIWGVQINSSAVDVANSIVLSADETLVYAVGTYLNSPVLFQLNASTGELLKSYSYPATTSGPNVPTFTDAVVCGSFLCVCGHYYPNATDRMDGLVIRFDTTTLTPNWTKIVLPGGVATFDDKINTIAFSSSNRLFIGGETSRSNVGKEFYVAELDFNTGNIVTERIWPNGTCTGFDDRDQWISDIAVSTTALYFVGKSTQDFLTDGTPAVCGTSVGMAYGALNLSNLSQYLWFYNLSRIVDGFTVEGNSLQMGADGNIYIGGDSDSDALLGQSNTSPIGLIYDWFYYVVNGSTGSYVDFRFTGAASTDDFLTGTSVRSQAGKFALSAYSNDLVPGATAYIDLFSTIPDPSPTPSVTPSPSMTPSVTPSSSVAASASSSPSFGYTPSPSASPFRPSAGGGGNSKLPIILGVVLGAAVIGLVGAVMFFAIKRRRDKERRDRMKNMGPEEGGSNANAVRLSVLESINRHSALLDNWHIDYRQIEIGAEIGRGAYGTVFRGKWRGSTVAVKQLNLEKTDQRAIEDFIKEASAVKRLRNHRNVCQIFGVCSDPEYPICIVMEYMEDGNLQNLVYKGKVHLDVDAVLTMAKHTASGMSHLHSENILHCDLACRNLLVSIGKGNKYLVKISDFGMARVVENEKIYNASSEAQFPVRWSAPEVLSSGTVSRKSDVWSFGVTVWEMIEGVKPYYELASNKEVIEFVVVNGYRLPRPKKLEIPATLWEIMNQCWSANPAERPEFDEILKKLSNLKKALRASTRASQLHDPNANPGEVKQGGEDYLTIGEFKKGKDVTSVNSDEEYNTLGGAKKQNTNNNNGYTNKTAIAATQDEDTYNKVSVKLTADATNTEDDYKAVIHLKADAQGRPPVVAPNQDEDTYNKINFKNEFASQKNNAADESDYLQINKPIFGGPANAPAKQTQAPPPRVEESDYTARVNLSNEFSSGSQSADNDDYSTVRLNTTAPSTIRKPQQGQPQQQPAEEDNYSKVVLKTNSSASVEESDYNVINLNKKDERKQSNVQDLYLNNNKKDMK
mmetsp:Transcript_2855/g.3782  ORF Transcript_2855/g.3782 Transcript_2855/m.3782 type:complete len:1119 (+) Transcript_2855:84-3440(+)